MLKRLAHLATNHARSVLVVTVVFFAVAGALSSDVADRLISGGFDDPASESSEADKLLADQFDAGLPNVVVLVTAKDGDVDDSAVAAAGTELADRLKAEPDVTRVLSYWSENNAPPLRSKGGDRALVVGRINSNDEDVLNDRIEDLGPQLLQSVDSDAVTVQIGGYAEVFREIGTTIEEDLVRAELVALPLTLILLVVIFGSLVAASLPVAVGGLSIVGTFLVLRILTDFTDVSLYALNLTTMAALGLGIDYSMFVVARFREELRRDPTSPRQAAVRTVLTAGRTVAFSALTVAASLAATLVFPFAFLRSMAYAGVAVALLAGTFSLLVLPAILALLGHRVNSLTLWRRSVTPPEAGGWHRVARFVMRRPLPIAAGVTALLVVLGLPFLGIKINLPDDRVLPESASSRQANDVIREEFSSAEIGTLSVVAGSMADTDQAAVDDYAERLAHLPGVSRVDASGGTFCGEGLADQLGCSPGQLVLPPDTSDRYAAFNAEGGTFLSVVPSVEPYSDVGEQLVDDVRNESAPFDVQVSGLSAELVDSNASLFRSLPYALGIVAIITVVLLFLMFGSVVIPLKAIVLNLLSLSATFGAMVWVFQDGHMSGLLDFTPTGGLAAANPILMFCVAFGLSMDYEVFLLSRIKEEHDRGADNTTAVASGLERTGRIVTAAALLIAVVFVAFATSRVSFIKMFGVGLTLAVLLDAFVIRGTLVPAFMRLAGEWNWWAPGPLRRLHERWGISESAPEESDSREREPTLVS